MQQETRREHREASSEVGARGHLDTFQEVAEDFGATDSYCQQASRNFVRRLWTKEILRRHPRKPTALARVQQGVLARSGLHYRVVAYKQAEHAVRIAILETGDESDWLWIDGLAAYSKLAGNGGRPRVNTEACPQGHPASLENMRWYKGSRFCRVCDKAGFRLRWLKKKAAEAPNV